MDENNKTDGVNDTTTPAPEETTAPAIETPAAEVVAAATPATTLLTSARKRQLITAAIVVVLGGIIAGGYYLYVTRYEPVAVVNGFKIARKEFNDSVSMITQTASLQGADITDTAVQQQISDQAMEILVSNKLLLEGASAKGITADETAVQAEYDKLIAELGTEDELKKRMAEVGISEAKLRSNIGERLIVDAYLKAETDIDEVKIEESDLKARYDSYVAGGVQIPPYEEVKAQLESQMLGEKQQEIVNNFIASLKEKAAIEINL